MSSATAILLLSIVGSLAAVATAITEIGGVQTGPLRASSYASGMVYDAASGQIYMVGNTYDVDGFREGGRNSAGNGGPADDDSSCFVASVDWSVDTDLDWDFDWLRTFGRRKYDESCPALAAMPGHQSLVVAGNAEDTTHLFDDTDSPDLNGEFSGFVMSVDKGGPEKEALGGSVIAGANDATFSDRIAYPHATAIDPVSEHVYVAAVTSRDDVPNPDPKGGFPDWIRSEKYGSSFYMSLHKYAYKSDDAGVDVLRNVWSRHYPLSVVEEADEAREMFEEAEIDIENDAYVGGVIYKKMPFSEHLIVAGSTRGQGKAYGASFMDDEDGYISVLKHENGNVVGSMRIGTDLDDVITGICHDPDDMKYVYVVGASYGDMGSDSENLGYQNGSLRAFVRKVDISAVGTDDAGEAEKGEWTIQFGAVFENAEGADLTSAYALGCAVAPRSPSDGHATIYVAGNVEGGASMIAGGTGNVQPSRGGDDAWIARVMDHDSGRANVRWMKQFGTTADERLAQHTPVACGPGGHPVLYGETTGSMFRDRLANEHQDKWDVFVMSFHRDTGDHTAHDAEDGVDNGNGGGGSAPASTPKPKPDKLDEKDGPAGSMAAIGALVLAVVLAVACCVCVSKRNRRASDERRKTTVFKYLQNFDVEDVDLRPSAVGGFHGTYMNKLAQGESDYSKEVDMIDGSRKPRQIV